MGFDKYTDLNNLLKEVFNFPRVYDDQTLQL